MADPDRGRRRRPRAPVPAGGPGDAGTVVGAGQGHPAGGGQAPPVDAYAGVARGRRLSRLRSGLRPARPGHDPPHRRRPEAEARLRRRGQRLRPTRWRAAPRPPTRPGRGRPPSPSRSPRGPRRRCGWSSTWTDFAAVHVQNNLELVVTGPDLPIAVGNGENSFGKSSLFHPSEQEEFAGVTPDPANNVEQVTVPKPKPGEYRIRVIAENTPFPPQGFAVCVTGDLVVRRPRPGLIEKDWRPAEA